MSGETYLILKSIHIIAVISWMAGLFYLPRLFVYHAAAAKGSELSETLKIMERRLVKAIMIPAMTITWIMGFGMAFSNDLFSFLWFDIKFVLVIGMTIVQFWLIHYKNCFARDENTHSHKFYRFFNEIPTLLMIIIVPLVILKPDF